MKDDKRNHSSGGVRWTGLLYGLKTESNRVELKDTIWAVNVRRPLNSLLLTATKGDGRPAHRKQASDFAVRYVVGQCCHYQPVLQLCLKA